MPGVRYDYRVLRARGSECAVEGRTDRFTGCRFIRESDTLEAIDAVHERRPEGQRVASCPGEFRDLGIRVSVDPDKNGMVLHKNIR
jgi:hypothetical protein